MMSFSDPNVDELKRLMMVHGGVFRNYYTRTSVTHIIANNLPDSKIKDLKDKKVVKPLWITDR
jgi:DNA repair protein REV1